MKHIEIVHAAIKKAPGRTSAEIAKGLKGDYHFWRTATARRLVELERSGLISRNTKRECKVTQRSCWTWKVSEGY